MTTLPKIWMLKDDSTKLEIISNFREEIAGYEHSLTTIHEGYFITKEQLEQLIQTVVYDADVMYLGLKKLKPRYFKLLGVE